MKERTKDILLVIAIVLLVLCLFQIIGLKNKVNNIYNRIGNVESRISSMDSDIRNITSNVEDTLKKQSSIISDSNFEFGDLNAETLTAELNAYVTPKEYSEKNTTATLYIGDNGYPMTRDKDTFRISVDMSLFENEDAAKVVFREGDTVRTETLEWWLNPRVNMVPTTYAHFDGGSTGSADKESKNYVWKPDGTVGVDIENKWATDINRAELLYFLDGKKIASYDMELLNNQSTATCQISESVDIPFGSTLDVYTVVTDGLGLRHVNLVEHVDIDRNGFLDVNVGTPDYPFYYGEDIIYDKDGNLVYSPYTDENTGADVIFPETMNL